MRVRKSACTSRSARSSKARRYSASVASNRASGAASPSKSAVGMGDSRPCRFRHASTCRRKTVHSQARKPPFGSKRNFGNCWTSRETGVSVMRWPATGNYIIAPGRSRRYSGGRGSCRAANAPSPKNNRSAGPQLHAGQSFPKGTVFGYFVLLWMTRMRTVTAQSIPAAGWVGARASVASTEESKVFAGECRSSQHGEFLGAHCRRRSICNAPDVADGPEGPSCKLTCGPEPPPSQRMYPGSETADGLAGRCRSSAVKYVVSRWRGTAPRRNRGRRGGPTSSVPTVNP